MKKSILKSLGLALGFLAAALLVSLLAAFPVKWLWNWVVVELFYLEPISVLQAWGLSVLAQLLFRSGTAAKFERVG
jgi:hypothetical protein